MPIGEVESLRELGQPLAPNIGYAALMEPHADVPFEGLSFSPNPAYERYLKIHKVFVGKRGAALLENIHSELKDENMPRYLTTAGWAAVEAALVKADEPVRDRLDLLAAGISCWEQSLGIQRSLNAAGPPCLREYAAPYRTAMDIAVTPLLRGIIQGYVSRNVCRAVFGDCLNIAQANAVRINLSARDVEIEALAEHIGFGYECNALLALNRRFSGTMFAIPSMIRSDSGYHHSQQTHDLMIIEQSRGEIRRLTPVEIKAAASNRDRERYKALLVRGKMHLSVPGKYRPEDTLRALGACFDGEASIEEQRIARAVTRRFMAMFQDYCAGEELGEMATKHTRTVFHDNRQVVANHPGLLPKAG